MNLAQKFDKSFASKPELGYTMRIILLLNEFHDDIEGLMLEDNSIHFKDGSFIIIKGKVDVVFSISQPLQSIEETSFLVEK